MTLEKRVGRLSEDVKRNRIESMAIHDDANALFARTKAQQTEIQERVDAINRFGMSHHHVNLPIAHNEAKSLLNKIEKIVYHRNGNTFNENVDDVTVSNATKCDIDESFVFWTKQSHLADTQMNKTRQLKSDVINVKTRFDDAIERTYRTFDILSMANVTHENNRRHVNELQKHYQHIGQLRHTLHDIFNTNIFPQTNTMYKMIDDGNVKLSSDGKTIGNLKNVVQETNLKCDENLNLIQATLWPEAKAHSIDLIKRAEEYAKLFRNTKNGAEMAMRASTAYRNISDSIEATEKMAHEMTQAARISAEKLYPIESDSTVIEKSLASNRKSHEIKENAIREIDKVAGNLFLYVNSFLFLSKTTELRKLMQKKKQLLSCFTFRFVCSFTC